MSNVEHTPDATNPCPRRTPWCARHDHDLNFCWSVDVHHAGMILNLCNGTLTGEPKIFGLDDPRESFTLPEAESLEHALARLRALAALPQLPEPTPVADTRAHQPWCVDHDGGVCFGELFDVAGLRLQLAHSDGYTHVVGLDDPGMPDVLPMGDVAVLTAVLERLQAAAADDTAPPACSRYHWCVLAGDPDHATECASLVHHARDIHDQQWAMYLRATVGAGLVELAIDGLSNGVPLSGRIPASVVGTVAQVFHHDREAMLGVFAAASSVAGVDTLRGLARAAAVGTVAA